MAVAAPLLLRHHVRLEIAEGLGPLGRLRSLLNDTVGPHLRARPWIRRHFRRARHDDHHDDREQV